MKEYMVFALLMLAGIIIFIVLWKNRKRKNADVHHDIWADLVNDPRDEIP